MTWGEFLKCMRQVVPWQFWPSEFRVVESEGTSNVSCWNNLFYRVREEVNSTLLSTVYDVNGWTLQKKKQLIMKRNKKILLPLGFKSCRNICEILENSKLIRGRDGGSSHCCTPPLPTDQVPQIFTMCYHKCKPITESSIARVFQWRGGGDTVSKWRFSPDCHAFFATWCRLFA